MASPGHSCNVSIIRRWQDSPVGAAAAAALIGLTPILIAYLFLQKYFVKEALAGAEK